MEKKEEDEDLEEEDLEASFDNDDDESNWDSDSNEPSEKEPKVKIIKNNLFSDNNSTKNKNESIVRIINNKLKKYIY